MPAHKLVSALQMDVLLNFMAEHRDLATGRLTNDGAHGKQMAKKLWEDLANRLNNVVKGTKRTTDMWRRYWNERKYTVKKKALLAVRHSRSINGVSPRKLFLPDEDMRIFKLIGKLDVNKNTPDINSNPVNEFKDLSPTLEDPLEHLVIEQCPPPPLLDCKAEPIKPSEHSPTASSDEDEQDEQRIRLEEPPRWAIDIEERRLAATERLVNTVERLTDAVVSMQSSLHTLTTEVAGIRTMLHSKLPP